jgi:hypothetical protein
MKALRVGLLIISLWALAGCDRVGSPANGRYSTERDSSGNIFIVDTQTGAVEVLRGDSRREIPRESEISKAKELPSRELPGMPVEVSNLTLKYRDGLLLYKGVIKIANRKPASRRPEAKGHGNNAIVAGKPRDPDLFQSLEGLWKSGSVSEPRRLIFQLTDVDGFDTASFTVARESLRRVVDGAGSPVSLDFSGSQPIDTRGYKAIYSYFLGSNLAEWKEPNTPTE